MKSKEEIAELILDEFRKINSRANDIIMMHEYHSVILKLNPIEQNLLMDVVKDLQIEGYIIYEDGQSVTECFRLTEKGFNRIWDVIENKESELPTCPL